MPTPTQAGSRDAPLGIAHSGQSAAARLLLIGLISFLTLVDLFAAQAILPRLTATYGVTPSQMGVAVNASTAGMAVAGLLVALFGGMVDRKRGIWMSLAALSAPTAALAFAPDLATFTALRVAQGVFMSAAFTFTVTYLAEHGEPMETAGALAAYVTGNVASNLAGRIISAAIADGFGLEGNFLAFAVLNLAGSALVLYFLVSMKPMGQATASAPAGVGGARFALVHLGTPRLLSLFALGFLILFAFLGIFTYVNFVLVREPLRLSAMSLGLVYLVFLPAMLTTPLAGWCVQRWGPKRALLISLGAALSGLPLLLTGWLPAVLLGLAMVGAGTFAAQAMATALVATAADAGRGVASGLYLASYYAGGLVGSALIGAAYDRLGWPAAVGVVGAALIVACVVALRVGVSPSARAN